MFSNCASDSDRVKIAVIKQVATKKDCFSSKEGRKKR